MRRSPEVYLGFQQPPSIPTLKESTVIITGAASGMGRLLAIRFIRAGARVYGLDVDQDRLLSVSSELGDRFTGIKCDLTNPEEIESSMASVLADAPAVDILINNAGIASGKYFLELNPADVERTFRVNVLAHFYTVRAVLPSMIESGSGQIVTFASAGGIVAAPRLTAYSSSKFAAVGFDESLRMEMKKHNYPIDTTLIAPFFINTGMFEGVKTRFPFLLPILKPEKVADRAFRAIQRKKRRLIMPWFVYTSFLLKILPVNLFDWIADFFGVSRTMDDFTGPER